MDDDVEPIPHPFSFLSPTSRNGLDAPTGFATMNLPSLYPRLDGVSHLLSLGFVQNAVLPSIWS